jgi:hypothetical protein
MENHHVAASWMLLRQDRFNFMSEMPAKVCCMLNDSASLMSYWWNFFLSMSNLCIFICNSLFHCPGTSITVNGLPYSPFLFISH